MKEILQDIRQGKNIETYLIIVISFVILVIDVFVSTDPIKWTIGAILACLAILAYGRMEDRRRLEFISLPSTNEASFLERFPDDMNVQIRKSSELWLVGVSLHSFIEDHYREFDEMLKNGSSIKVLLVNPEDQACNMAAMRMPVPSFEFQASRIRNSLNSLLRLKQSGRKKRKIEIRVINNPLDFEAYVVDPKTKGGVLYMRHFGFKTDRGIEPNIVVHANKGHWFTYFFEEVSNLWQEGREWEPS